MKRLFTICFAMTMVMALNAQNEGEVTTLSDLEMSHYKNIDGFLLDMNSMLGMEPVQGVPSYLMPPTLTYRPFDAYLPAYGLMVSPDAVRINQNLTFQGNVAGVSLLQSFRSLYSPVGGDVNWQGASYKLKNGMRINTYGEYNADGYKVYNPSALPWERNRFNAAFEIKSANGNFGIKVEMQGGRNNLY